MSRRTWLSFSYISMVLFSSFIDIALGELRLYQTLPKTPPPCVQKSKEGFTHVKPTDWNACTRRIEGFLRIPLDHLQTVYLTPAPPKQVLATNESPLNANGTESKDTRTLSNVSELSIQQEPIQKEEEVPSQIQQVAESPSSESHIKLIAFTNTYPERWTASEAISPVEQDSVQKNTKVSQPDSTVLDSTVLDSTVLDSSDSRLAPLDSHLASSTPANSSISHSKPFDYHGHSLVLLPPKLKVRKPYVMVYLHGFHHDVVNQQTLPVPRLEYDHFSEQIQKSGHGRDVISLFPQADTKTPFSHLPAKLDFDISANISEVFSRLQLKTSPEKLPLILIGHSGGGRVLRRFMTTTPFENVKAVAFLDGLNGEKEIPLVKEYLSQQIEKQLDWLQKHSSPKQRNRYFQSIPQFSFYYTFQYTTYPKIHQQLARWLHQFWIEKNQKAPKNQKLFLARLRHYYQVIPLDKTITHSDIMRSGVIEKILKRLPRLAG